jgi:hypothetical protein
MNSLFEKIKEDLKKGIEDGISVLKEQATAFYGKVDEIKAVAKKQYNIFDLQTKIQDEMTKLGGRVYDVYNSNKSIDEDKKVKAAFAKIKKLEWQLGKIEGVQKAKASSSPKPEVDAKSAAPKSPRKAVEKAAPQKTTKRKTEK